MGETMTELFNLKPAHLLVKRHAEQEKQFNRDQHDHGGGPQYNPHRDNRRPGDHQADTQSEWHQAR